MQAFGITDTGKRRERNEDSILLNRELMLFIVADGMGGHAQGDVASQTAVRVINEILQEHIKQVDSEKPVQDEVISELLNKAIVAANKAIFDQSRKLRGEIMGTTVSLLLLRDQKAFTAHVGDSRIYRIRKGNLEKLTKDHSKAQELVDAGLLTEAEAENHSSSHILTRALGSTNSVVPVIESLDVKRGDRFFLSTDGLFRVLNSGQLKDVLVSDETTEDKCRSLIEKALEGVAPDNVSVILVEPEKKGLLGRIFS